MKSTHSGHCQACGRLQKMPAGLLSLHGYTVAHGYFSGTCNGSKHQPFELSCDMLPGFIANAQKALAQVEKDQAMLRTMPTIPQAWVRNYEGERYGHNNYIWRSVQVNGRLKTYGDSSWVEYFYVAPTPNGRGDGEHKIETYGIGLQSADNKLIDYSLLVALHLNKQRAQAMELEAQNLRRYIAWQ